MTAWGLLRRRGPGAAAGAVLRRLGRALALAGLVACAPLPANAPTLTSDVYDVPLDGVPLRPGISEHTVMVNGRPRRFGLWVPPAGATDGHPVILFLHGAQRHPNFRFLECFIEPELAPLSPVVIAPEATLGLGGEWWRGDEASYALGLLRSVVRRWPVDDRRVVVMGYSNGGIGTWVFAGAYPQYFTAAIPMAFNHTVVGQTPLPVFAIQGEKDELFGSSDVARAVKGLKDGGADVTLAILPRGSHFKGCSCGEPIARARDWLLDSVWARRTPAAPPAR